MSSAATNGRVVTQWPCSMSAFHARSRKPDADVHETEAAPPAREDRA
jgi:hypothetical protein